MVKVSVESAAPDSAAKTELGPPESAAKTELGRCLRPSLSQQIMDGFGGQPWTTFLRAYRHENNCGLSSYIKDTVYLDPQ